MKTIEMADATAPLQRYVRAARRETLVVTLKGKPVAALTPIGPHTDLENLAVSGDPQFRALIRRSRRRHPAGSGLTTAAVGRKLQRLRRPDKRSSR